MTYTGPDRRKRERRAPALSDLQIVLGLAAALLGAGIWLGTLANRVTQLERTQRYLHGDVVVPPTRNQP